MTDSRSALLEGAAAGPGSPREGDTSRTTPGARHHEPNEGGETLDARVEEVRRLFGSNVGYLLSRLEDKILRRVGLSPTSSRGLALAGLMGVAMRLALAMLVTALVGQWASIPWGRWAAILVFYGLFDGTQPMRTPPLDAELTPWIRRAGENMTPLLSTIVRESDLQDLASFIRRWSRLPVVALVGVTVATLMLGTSWLLSPTGMSELPAGSIVLLAFLLYDFGALMVYGDIFEWAFTARQARYEHHLFWPSPADTPAVRKAMQMWNVRALAFWISVFLVLTLVLVPWDSPVAFSLACGFIVIGYLTTIGAALGDRANIRRIIERARNQRLEVLQHRIDSYGPRFADLSPEESERLGRLIGLHTTIRDAPATPTSHTLLRAAAGLIVPTIVFVISVFGEVSAERLIDAIIP